MPVRRYVAEVLMARMSFGFIRDESGLAGVLSRGVQDSVVPRETLPWRLHLGIPLPHAHDLICVLVLAAVRSIIRNDR